MYRPELDGLLVRGIKLALVAFSCFMAARTLVNVMLASHSDSMVAYWTFRFGPHLYDQPAFSWASHEYPPPFALVMAPLTSLPWPAFVAAWTALQLGLLGWLVGPRLLGLVLLTFPAQWAVWNGNMQLLYALVAGLGLRYPALWAIPLLTKITPGIGVLWFALRREWRALAIVSGVTVALVIASDLLAPESWGDWLGFATSSTLPDTRETAVPVPFWIRFPLVIALLVWGARRDQRWVLAVTVWLAMPTAWWLGAWALVVPLREWLAAEGRHAVRRLAPARPS